MPGEKVVLTQWYWDPAAANEAGGAGGPAGHQVVLDVLAVNGAVLSIDPDEIKTAAGNHLGDKGTVEAHVGSQGNFSLGNFIRDLMCVVHLHPPLRLSFSGCCASSAHT